MLRFCIFYSDFFISLFLSDILVPKNDMLILKFGGTSVGTESQIKKVVNYLKKSPDSKIVIFSAISGVTNYLSEFIKQVRAGNLISAEQIAILLEEKHRHFILKLFKSDNFKNIALQKLNTSVKFLTRFLNKRISESGEKEIIVQGEVLSVMIIYLYMLELGLDVGYLDPVRFLKIDKNGEPDYKFIRKRLLKDINRKRGCKFYITNGFVCINHRQRIDHLGRGGSDYTATIIGKALHADKIEIWTDIDGLQNNDPRYVDDTYPIRHLSYDEASELAYFGAKILHPASIIPARQANIPVSIKNSMNFEAEGTLISNFSGAKNLSAVAAKDGVTIIKIKSGRMMQAYGFLRKIFEVFEKYQTPVDMLTTSEISVAMTIDNCLHLEEIITDLKVLGEIEIANSQSIICIAGNFHQQQNILIQKVIDAFEQIPIRMISFGASPINFSMVVDTENKREALQLLNNKLFKSEQCLTTS